MYWWAYFSGELLALGPVWHKGLEERLQQDALKFPDVIIFKEEFHAVRGGVLPEV